jgi:hypothetical protein
VDWKTEIQVLDIPGTSVYFERSVQSDLLKYCRGAISKSKRLVVFETKELSKLLKGAGRRSLLSTLRR